MTSRLAAVLVVGVLVSACSGSGDKQAQQASVKEAPADATAGDRAALDKLRADYVTAYNAHDAAALAVLFTDSCFAVWADGSVNSGRAAVQAWAEQQMAGNPTVAIDTKDMMVFEGNAVSHGSYTIEIPPAAGASGSPVSVSGRYITYFKRVNGAWKIDRVLTNFATTPPAGMKMVTDNGPPPAVHGSMGELENAWMKAFNAKDWAGLAALYTPDAYASYGPPPIADLNGRDAIQAAYAGAFGKADVEAELHDVASVSLSPEYSLDRGWYRFSGTTAQGKVEEWGMILVLLQKQPDGSWKLRWDLSRSQPTPAT